MSNSNNDFDFDTYLEDLKNTPIPEEFQQEQRFNTPLDEQLDEILFLLTLLSALNDKKLIIRKK